jgi:hypothetical protein
VEVHPKVRQSRLKESTLISVTSSYLS